MKGKSVTLTVIANMTSNYGEGLGNISSVQKSIKTVTDNNYVIFSTFGLFL